jgi:hypothetical protein
VTGEPMTFPKGTDMMKRTVWIFGWMLLPALLAAQSPPAAAGPRGFVSTAGSFQQWSFENNDKPLRETVFPLTAFYRVSPDFSLTVSNTPGSARYDTVSISGLSDTWIRGTYLLSDGRFMLHAGVGAPTGKTRLKIAQTDSAHPAFDQFVLSQMIGQNIFRFRLPVFGQGLSTKIGAGVALPMGPNAVFGAGIHYISKGEFTPVDSDSFKYKPGDETSISAGVDMKLGPNAKWTVNLNYTLYGRDKLNGREVYGSGKKLLVNTSVSTRLGAGVLYANLNWRQRGKNENWVSTGLQTETKNSNGSQTELDWAWQIPWSPQGSFSVLGTGRFYGQNDYQAGGATLIGGGAGVSYAFSAKTTGQLSLIYLSGSIKEASVNHNMTGLDVMAGLTFGL